MKKTILFVIPSLGSGGAEKSLINLLSLFDYDKYDVDLLSFRRDGLFFDGVNKNVNVIGGTENYEMFDGDAKKAVSYFIKKCKFISAVDRLKYAKAYEENDKWNLLKKQLPKIKKEYDCAVGYLEGNASKFVIDEIKAKKKIIYVHNDFEKLELDKNISKRLFSTADKVVTVSERCLECLDKNFESIKDKFIVIENIISPKILRQEALKDTAYDREKIGNKTVLLTVGRFYKQKAIDLAVKTCAELKKRDRDIVWYHIGSGGLEDEIKNLVSSLQVENDFIMLGERSNPYPYIGQCDIYVQTSKFEGKSIAIDEAKCLCKPIVVTNFQTVYDQISDTVNGLICEMNENDIADKIEYLIDNPAVCKKLSDTLKNEKTGNEEEINKFYQLIEA